MILWSVLLGCSKPIDEVIPAPPLLSPLESENLAPEVPAEGDDLHPEGMTSVSGQFDDGIFWAHAKANIAVDAGAVWTCFQDTDTVVDRREVDEWSAERDVEPQFDFSMTIHQTVDDVLTVEYDSLWLHEAREGTTAAPEEVVLTWQKSDGTTFVQLLSGSAVLTVAEAEVTRIELIAWLDAAARDDETLLSYLTDLTDSVTACAHGEALPVY